MSSSAKSLRNIFTSFRSEPLAEPYKAKQIPSKIVVFPAPVEPEITNRRLSCNFVKSIVSSFLYGPKARIVSLIGFIGSPPPLLFLVLLSTFHLILLQTALFVIQLENHLKFLGKTP